MYAFNELLFSFTHSEFATPALSTKLFVKEQSEALFTTIVNEAELLPLLPAASTAVALTLLAPSANVKAAPLTFAQVDEATPDRLSLLLQAIETFWSTE